MVEESMYFLKSYNFVRLCVTFLILEIDTATFMFFELIMDRSVVVIKLDFNPIDISGSRCT